MNQVIAESMHRAQCLSLAVLSLCSKLYEISFVHVRELARLIHPRYKKLDLEKLEGDEEEDTTEEGGGRSLGELEEQIKEWEIRVMVWLRWKLAVPLLYDEVLSIAYLWDTHTGFLGDFPLKF